MLHEEPVDSTGEEEDHESPKSKVSFPCTASHKACATVEPPNKGHFGNRSFVLSSEVVPISEVHRILILYHL